MDDATRTKWQGRWDQLKGQVRESWGELTDDDVDVAEGQYDQLVGRIAERTGEQGEAVRDRIATFEPTAQGAGGPMAAAGAGEPTGAAAGEPTGRAGDPTGGAAGGPVRGDDA